MIWNKKNQNQCEAPQNTLYILKFWARSVQKLQSTYRNSGREAPKNYTPHIAILDAKRPKIYGMPKLSHHDHSSG